MCRRRRDTLASEPRPKSSSHHSRTTAPSSSSSFAISSRASQPPSSATASSGVSSLASLADFLPDKLNLYSFQEISAATNSFLSKRLSSGSSSWRCTLRDKDVVIFQRKFHGDFSDLRRHLPAACKIHHNCVIPLLGASLSGDQIYLVYEHVESSSLADCLRNPKSCGYKGFSSWVRRLQVAVDLAQGLEYIHHYSGGGRVHSLISSSTMVVSYPQLRGKISLFGAFELCGEKNGSSCEVQKGDVFAFGEVLLELLSGEEPIKYVYREETEEYIRVSQVETARDMMGSDERKRIRPWIDPRLMDSFPVDIVEKAVQLAVECAHETVEKRPSMDRVARKLSSLLLCSRSWADRLRVPEEIEEFVGPR